MPLDPVPAGKCRGNDSNLEMALAITCARMPGVQVTLVLDEQFCRAECRCKDLVDTFGAVAGHGNTSLKGFTVTL